MTPSDVPDAGIDVSFFVPCLNEEDNVVGACDCIVATTEKLGLKYEILIFDDNSTDGTVARVHDYLKAHSDVPLRLFQNDKTRGLGYNYTEGAFQGLGKYYMLVNGDNSESAEVMAEILSHVGEAEIVAVNFRGRDYRPWYRRWLSIVFTTMVNRLSGYCLRYYNGPNVHLRYNVMRWHSDTQGFAYQAELITRLLDQGVGFTEVSVPNHDRPAGLSKAFRVMNMISVAYSLFEILMRRARRVLLT